MNKLLHHLNNKYAITIIVFGVWMLFFDNNNFIAQIRLNRSLHELEMEKQYYLSEIEKDRKGIPILIKQYLKLGGQILGFNRDPNFSDVLDVLIMVDLTQTDKKVLARYFGPEEAASFIHIHNERSLAQSA